MHGGRHVSDRQMGIKQDDFVFDGEQQEIGVDDHEFLDGLINFRLRSDVSSGRRSARCVAFAVC